MAAFVGFLPLWDDINLIGTMPGIQQTSSQSVGTGRLWP